MAKRIYHRKCPFTRPELLRLVGNGKFCTIMFIKRTDGSLRTMNCRLGVKKYALGVGLKFSPSEKNLVSVFDAKKKAYRFVAVEGVLRVDANGESHRVYQS